MAIKLLYSSVAEVITATHRLSKAEDWVVLNLPDVFQHYLLHFVFLSLIQGLLFRTQVSKLHVVQIHRVILTLVLTLHIKQALRFVLLSLL